MLEFQEAKAEFKFEGKVYSFRFPSVSDIDTYQTSLEDKGKSDIKKILDFLEILGLERSIAERLRPEQLEKLMKVVTEEDEEKKN